jgi:hypothetical protein
MNITPPAKRIFYDEKTQGKRSSLESSLLASNSSSCSRDCDDGNIHLQNSTVSETSFSSEGDNIKLKQAVCSVCRILIPNLYDVMESSMDESQVPDVHKCEKCGTPTQQDTEFIFTGSI